MHKVLDPRTPKLISIAEEEGLFVLDDAAQAFGATYKNRRLGALAPATATSFFPAKPLGCYGDGGAVLTEDEELAQVMRSVPPGFVGNSV